MHSATSSNAGAAGAAALLIGAALVGFDGGAIGVVLPAVRADLGTDPQRAAWMVSLYTLGALVAIPATGAAVRRFDAHAVFRLCTALAAAGALIAILSDGIVPLLGARLVQGLAQGPLLPMAAVLIAVRWPAERQGRLMGAISIAYGAAFLAGITVTPFLLLIGWRAVFGLMLVLALAALLVAGPGPAQVPEGQSRLAVPGLQHNREMGAIAVLAFGTGVGQAAIVLFPSLAVLRLGVTPAAAGFLMLPLALAGIAATLAVAALLDRLGAKRLVVTGAVATLAGILIAAAAPASQMTLLTAAAVLGVGMAALSGGPLRYAAGRAVPATAQGPAQAAVALLTNVGLIGGSLLIGALAARGGNERSAMEVAMLAACGVMAASFIATVFLRPHTSHTSRTL